MIPHDLLCPCYDRIAECRCDWIAIIRADERNELRAKIEALQAQPFAQVGASGWDSISRADVLALLDGKNETMTRDELKNAAYAELTAQSYLGKIDRIAAVDVAVDVICNELRAKVKDMTPASDSRWFEADVLLWRSQVLALFDGKNEQ